MMVAVYVLVAVLVVVASSEKLDPDAFFTEHELLPVTIRGTHT
jgi:hypothetical protein